MTKYTLPRRIVDIDAAESALLLGGAAFDPFFGKYLPAKLPIFEVVDDPQTGNLVGAFAALSGQPAKKARKQR
jgi:hypothetical protein